MLKSVSAFLDTISCDFQWQEFQIGEFCAGMASGSIVCAGLQKVLKEEINGRVSFDTTFYTEMVKWKRGVIETVHQACHSTPALIAVTTGEAAQAVKHGDLRYRCSIAIKGLECDDISTCSSTQKSEPWHCLYPLLNRSM